MEGDGPKKQQTSDTGGLRGDTSLGRGNQSQTPLAFQIIMLMGTATKMNKNGKLQ